MSSTDTKPTISVLEANWHTHLAGVQSEKAARAQGMKDSESTTLLDAAAGGRVINGVTFPPINAGYVMLLAKASQICEKRPELAPQVMGSDLGHLGALALILHDSKQAWQIMSHPQGEELFVKAVIEFAMEFTLQDLRVVVGWMNEEMERLQGHGAAAGKPPAE